MGEAGREGDPGQPEQPAKAPVPIWASPGGRVTRASPEPVNAPVPIWVSPAGSVSSVKPVQPSKARLPIWASPAWRVTWASPEQPAKANVPSSVASVGNSTQTGSSFPPCSGGSSSWCVMPCRGSAGGGGPAGSAMVPVPRGLGLAWLPLKLPLLMSFKFASKFEGGGL